MKEPSDNCLEYPPGINPPTHELEGEWERALLEPPVVEAEEGPMPEHIKQLFGDQNDMCDTSSRGKETPRRKTSEV